MNQRTVFGFARTECACAECVLNCQHMPGYLIPEDLPALAAELGYDNWEKFAFENLAASQGATVLMRDGQTLQIPTLVPQRQANGACKFLDELQRLVFIAATRDLVLGCWCSPQSCHADVIKNCVEYLSRCSSNQVTSL